MHMSKKIIGLIGFIGSGKDTVADYLVEKYNFERLSFAGTLKDAVAAVFGWNREMVEGKTKEAREWREQVDPWWAERLGISKLSPRWVLQQWGTEVCRQNFHDDIWIASLEHQLITTEKNIVISDCRFPNEINAIRTQGGTVGRVFRGSNPSWYKTAELANSITNPQNKEEYARVGAARHQLGLLNVHPSESAWIGSAMDFEIDNNHSLEDLYKTVDLVFNLKVGN